MVGRSKKKKRSNLLGNHQRSYVWGRHAVLEILTAGRWPVRELFLRDTLDDTTRSDVEAATKELSLKVTVETGDQLAKRCNARDHQGLVARMGPFPYSDEDAVFAGSRGLILFLDRMQDPFNFGAVLRSAVIFGVNAVVIGMHQQTGITSQVARSSVGAVNHVSIVRSESLVNSAAALKSLGYRILAASEQGSASPADCIMTGPVGLIIGNEGSGIAPELLDQCDEQVAIPQRGKLDSLNAAVSAGILLYEYDRQTRAN